MAIERLFHAPLRAMLNQGNLLAKMKPLTIELTKGAKRQLQSVGWKTPGARDCRRHFFALTPEGNPLLITPKIAMPDYYDPNRQARAVLSGDPFPEAVCVDISACRLLAPPCYQSREDFESQLPCHAAFDPWKWIYWQTHRQVLIPEPSDEGPLQERLDKWLAAMRKTYEHEAALWRNRIKFVKTATLKKLGFSSERQRSTRLAELRGQLGIVESESRIEGVPCKGRLRLTLADVKRGHEDIRDAWMHEDWAAKQGWDLAEMYRERNAFRHWLETHTGTPANVFNMTTRQRRQEIEPPRFGEKFEKDPQFLEACAMVRYRARFADNANSVVYLADCELRDELTAEERGEATRLTKTPASPPYLAWHSEGFATLRRSRVTGEIRATLPLTNEFRALLQLLSDRPDHTAQYSEIEPQIGTRTHQLDTAAAVSNPALKGKRRIRDMLQIGRAHV